MAVEQNFCVRYANCIFLKVATYHTCNTSEVSDSFSSLIEFSYVTSGGLSDNSRLLAISRIFFVASTATGRTISHDGGEFVLIND